MKQGRHVGERGGGTDRDVPRPSAPPFAHRYRIVRFEACKYGAKLAMLTIDVDGLGSLDLEYYAPADRPSFVAGGSIKSLFSHRYERSIELDPAFADEIRAAVETRLDALSSELA